MASFFAKGGLFERLQKKTSSRSATGAPGGAGPATILGGGTTGGGLVSGVTQAIGQADEESLLGSAGSTGGPAAPSSKGRDAFERHVGFVNKITDGKAKIPAGPTLEDIETKGGAFGPVFSKLLRKIDRGGVAAGKGSILAPGPAGSGSFRAGRGASLQPGGFESALGRFFGGRPVTSVGGFAGSSRLTSPSGTLLAGTFRRRTRNAKGDELENILGGIG